MSNNYLYGKNYNKCDKFKCIKPLCYVSKPSECIVTKVVCKELKPCKPICPKPEPYCGSTQTSSPNIQITVTGSGSGSSSGTTGPTGATGPSAINAFAYAVFKTPFISNSPNGERSVPIAFLEDPTSDKRYSRLPFETMINASSIGVTSANTTIPADEVAFPGFGYPRAAIDTGNVLNYTFTTFTLQPGFWKVEWYVNLEFMIFPQKILNNGMNYYQLAISEQSGSNTPTVLNHTIRKGYGIPSFPPIDSGFTQGFVSGNSIIRVADSTLKYNVIFFKGPSIENKPFYAKLQFEPKDHADVFYQQTSISFTKVGDL